MSKQFFMKQKECLRFLKKIKSDDIFNLHCKIY